ncbi:MAG: HDOD domain-containing protein [Burkholderiales bacterium]
MSSFALVAAALLVVACIAAAFLFVRLTGRAKLARPRPPVRREAAPRAADFPPLEHNAAPPAGPAFPDPPPELATFRLMEPEDVDPARSATLSRLLQRLGKPVGGMQAVLSPQVLETEDSNELAQFVLREPTLAAKVLATVNSPFYCLQSPITSVGQAITFLGLNMTRNVVVRVLSQAAFGPPAEGVREVYERLWLAATVASEVAYRLAQRTRLRDPGAIATQALLSYFGDFAILMLYPDFARRVDRTVNCVARHRAEQHELGLDAPLAGSLLMREWELPAQLVDEVRDVARVLVSPPGRFAHRDIARLAACYMGVRVGERVAFGDPSFLAFVDFRTDPAPEHHYLAQFLARRNVAPLQDELRSPDVVAVVERTLGPALAT